MDELFVELVDREKGLYLVRCLKATGARRDTFTFKLPTCLRATFGWILVAPSQELVDWGLWFPSFITEATRESLTIRLYSIDRAVTRGVLKDQVVAMIMFQNKQ